MSVIGSNVLAGASGGAGAAGYQIERSVRLNSSDSAYFSRTPASAGNRRTFSWSGWVKRSALGSEQSLFNAWTDNSNRTISRFNSSDQLQFLYQNGGTFYGLTTAQVFRDPSAWLHVVLVMNTPDATSTDRTQIYINGSRIADGDLSAFSSGKYPPQNTEYQINSTTAHHIGARKETGSLTNTYLNGYLADIHFIDGQALAATDFGEYDDNNVWQPKEFEGSYTTSGVSFDFSEQQLYAGGTREALFDGSTSTGCNFQKTSASSSSTVPSNTKRIKVTFPTAKTGVTKLRIYGGGNTSSTNKVWYNDDESTMITNNDPVGWKTVYTGSAITINSISFGTSDGGSNLRAIEINDVVLTDAVEQGINSFRLDFSDASSNAALGTDSSGNNNDWTVNNLSGPGGDVDYASMVTEQSNNGFYPTAGPEKAFDGLLTTQPNTNATNNNGNITFTPSPSISHTTSVRAYWRNGNVGATYSYNGGTATSITATGWITLASGSGTFTSLNTYRPGDGLFFAAIEVDGTILITSVPGADNDSLIDTPTNYEAASGNNGGNYATLNPLDSSSNYTLSNGNLNFTHSTSGHQMTNSTIAVNSGKWYVEVTPTVVGGTYMQIGITPVTTSNTTYTGNNGYSYTHQGNKQGLTVSSSYGDSYAANDVIGIAFDADNQSLYFYKNGVIQDSGNAAFTGIDTSKHWRFSISQFNSGTGFVNFGQRPLAHPVSGYKSLCTTNLPDPTIADGSTAFDAKVRTGLGTNGGSVSGFNFSPDFLWEKPRNGTQDHYLMDAVRGSTKYLASNTTGSEGTNVNYVTAFTSDGFTVGSSDWNTSTSVIAWAWDAGSSNTTISAGSLNSYNTSSTWRSNWTASGDGFGSYPVSYIFDANLNNNMNNNAGGQYITWNTTSYTLSGELLINCHSSSGVYDIYVNGTKAADTPSSRGWVNCGTFADINEIQFAGTAYGTSNGLGSAGVMVYEIRVGGQTLIDSDVTPANVPTISSTVRANPSAGFSIVSVEGVDSTNTIRTAGHGLNATPEFIISKNRDFADNWVCYHKDIQTNNKQYLRLDTTDSTLSTSATLWAHTSSVIGFNGAKYVAAGNSDNLIFYCFAPVESYSSMGVYTGNGSADGSFVHTGFSVAFLLAKNTSSGSWYIFDKERPGYNQTNNKLYPNLSNAEASDSTNCVDLLSNGFKLRGTGGDLNSSGGTYIYAAFAENPFSLNGGLAR
jgi:hypothetical protein